MEDKQGCRICYDQCANVVIVVNRNLESRGAAPVVVMT